MIEIKKKISLIKKFAKKKKIKTAFIIGNTSKNYTKKYYLTPIRFNSKVIFFGVVVNSEIVVSNIVKLLDGKVDYILVDVEKKISAKNSIDNFVANLERQVRENTKVSKLYTYKGNDIVVDAVDTFLSFYFDKNIRGISGKKITILGGGNIGYKLSLKLVERGANIIFTRRNKKNLKILVKSINLIKPKSTISKVTGTINNFKATVDCDVLIAANSGQKIINSKIVSNLKKDSLIIDVGKGTIFTSAYNLAKKRNIKIFRADVGVVFENILTNISNLEKLYKNGLGRKKIMGENTVSGGLLAEKNEFIIDNINNPKVFYGVANGSGDFIFNFKKKNKILSRIKKFKKKLKLF